MNYDEVSPSLGVISFRNVFHPLYAPLRPINNGLFRGFRKTNTTQIDGVAIQHDTLVNNNYRLYKSCKKSDFEKYIKDGKFIIRNNAWYKKQYEMGVTGYTDPYESTLDSVIDSFSSVGLSDLARRNALCAMGIHPDSPVTVGVHQSVFQWIDCHYCFCVSRVYSDSLFEKWNSECGYDLCLEIRDPLTFSKILYEETRKVNPSLALVAVGQMSYLDPIHCTQEEIVNFGPRPPFWPFRKSMTYEWQDEVRIVFYGTEIYDTSPNIDISRADLASFFKVYRSYPINKRS